MLAPTWLQWRNLSIVNDELIPVGREYSKGQPHGCTGLVKRGPEDLEHPDATVLGQLEELRFCFVRGSDADPVAVPDLLEPKGFA